MTLKLLRLPLSDVFVFSALDLGETLSRRARGASFSTTWEKEVLGAILRRCSLRILIRCSMENFLVERAGGKRRYDQ